MTRARFFSFCAVTLLLQGSVLPLLLGGIWQPDLWLCASIIAVLVFDGRIALAMAAAGGLSQDIITGNFFGLHFFPYLIITLAVLRCVREKYNRKWLLSLSFVEAGTAGYMVLLWLVVYMGGGTVRPPEYFIYEGLPQFVMNGAAAFLLHHALWNMKREWVPKW